MPYGIIKVDQVTFTNAGVDQTISVSGIVASISGNITATGTISGNVIRGGTTVSGATVTGTAGQFGTITGNTAGFTTVTGTTVTGTTAQFTTVTGGTAGFTTITGTTVTGTTANFVTVSGTTVTGNVGNFTTITGGSAGFTTVTGTTITGTTLTVASGTFTGNSTAAAFIPTGSTVPTNGVYLPAANNVAVATNGSGRLFINSSGSVGIGTSSPVFLTDILSGTANTGANVNNPSQLSVTGPNKSLTAGGATVFINSNSDLAVDTGGSIALSGRNTTSSTNSVVWGVVKGAKENATSGNTAGYLTFASTNHAVGGLVEAMRIDSSQRVGIGTTSPSTLLHLASSSVDPTISLSRDPGSGNVNLIKSDFNDLTFTSYRHLLFTSGGTTERARIDSSGRLLVGTSTPSSYAGQASYFQLEKSGGDDAVANIWQNNNDAFGATLVLGKSRGTTAGSNTVVQSGDRIGEIRFHGADGNDRGSWAAHIRGEIDGTPGTDDMPGRLVFSTTADGASSPTERMRIDSAGTTYFLSTANTIGALTTVGAGTSTRLYYGSHSASGISGTISYTVWSNGNVVNTNNSYGSLSDAKLKENIVDATSQWDDLKALQVRKYNFKEETGHETHIQIGLVAQEVELVSPGLVSESPDRDAEGNDLGTVTKSVNYSVLYMKAVKALQEAMERIEQLESEMAAVKAQLS